jgi:nucleoside-diphosphate-sugar epimerase
MKPIRIAIFGATSQIAKDLVLAFSTQGLHKLTLFARRPEDVTQWLAGAGFSGRHVVSDFNAFGADKSFDAIINFVGSGNPAQVAAMGASIFNVTQKYDEMALSYLYHHPGCRYLFLSSGAAYGSAFAEPVDENSKAEVMINNLQPQDWYAVAKMYAECRHRSLGHLSIIDIRVFNYFSHTQDMTAGFLMTDILRAIQSGETLITSSDNIVRDYIGSEDFFRLVSLLLAAPSTNDVVDCYTKSPVDKMTLLAAMHERFGLRYEVRTAFAGINATGVKMFYFSKNRRANKFGYSPAKSSLDFLLEETRIALNKVDQ